MNKQSAAQVLNDTKINIKIIVEEELQKKFDIGSGSLSKLYKEEIQVNNVEEVQVNNEEELQVNNEEELQVNNVWKKFRDSNIYFSKIRKEYYNKTKKRFCSGDKRGRIKIKIGEFDL